MLFPVGVLYQAYALRKTVPVLIISLEEGIAVGVDSQGVYVKIRISRSARTL